MEELKKHKQKENNTTEMVKKFPSEIGRPLPTPEDLRNIWSEILKEIKEKSTTLSTLLVNSKIKGLENNIVSIELPMTNNYFKTTLEKSTKFIQTRISEKIHCEIKVNFIHSNKKEDIIEKAVKIFDAKIVQDGRSKNG